MLIEDKASGQQLVQTLRGANIRGVPEPIGRTPEMDNLSRAVWCQLHGSKPDRFSYRMKRTGWASSNRKFWLSPNGRHDDQVDAFSQLLGWVRLGWQFVESSDRPDRRCTPLTTTGNLIDSEGEDDGWTGNYCDGDPWAM